MRFIPWFFFSSTVVISIVISTLSHVLFLIIYLSLVCDLAVFFPFLVLACPAWLRWLVPLAPLLPLRPSFLVPCPVRYSRGIKPSAHCMLVRQTGQPCPTPTMLWTTFQPSKTAGLPISPPLSVLSSMSLCFALPNPHVQSASNCVILQLGRELHFSHEKLSERIFIQILFFVLLILCETHHQNHFV